MTSVRAVLRARLSTDPSLPNKRGWCRDPRSQPLGLAFRSAAPSETALFLPVTAVRTASDDGALSQRPGPKAGRVPRARRRYTFLHDVFSAAHDRERSRIS